MSGIASLLTSSSLPPPVFALSSHTIPTAGAAGNGVILFGVGVLRAMVGQTTTTSFAGEWLQSGTVVASEYEVFAVYIDGSVKHSSGAQFSTWHNLSSSPQFLLQTTGRFTLQIRRVGGTNVTPQVTITLT